MDVPEREHGREVGVGAGVVPVVEEGRAAEEVEGVVGELVELALGPLGPVEDPVLVVLAERAADVEAAVLVGEEVGRGDDVAGGPAAGVGGEVAGAIALGGVGALEDGGRG